MTRSAPRLFPAGELAALKARAAQPPQGLDGPPGLQGSWIYGAGSMGRFMVAYLRANGVEPAGFLDNRARLGGWEAMGLRVVAPAPGLVPPEAWIVIAVKEAAAELEAECLAQGHARFVRGWQAVHAWAGATRVPAYVSPAAGFEARWESYEDVVPLFPDAASRAVLKRAIQYQITCQDEDLPAFDPDEYFRPGLPAGQVYAEVVDCGAFDGDTLRAILRDAGADE